MRPNRKSKSLPKSVDQYLAALDDDKRAALERLRKAIHGAAPGVEECISYGMPGFRLKGRMLVWFGAAKNHCSFFPGGIVEEFSDQIKDFKTSKGTIRFQPDKPLPTGLVRKIVKVRMAMNADKNRKAHG